MDPTVPFVSLITKLGHKLSDIRDRSMKAVCRKVMSPLFSTEQAHMIGRTVGVAHLILQWINDRYDAVEDSLVQDVLRMVSILVSESSDMHASFLDAGAVSFFEDFGRHNPPYAELVGGILASLTRTVVERLEPELVPVESPGGMVVARPRTAVRDLDPQLEQWMFDLAVRIKFATAGTPVEALEEMSREIRFGSGMHAEAEAILGRPFLIEAICCQLSCSGPSVGPVNDFECLGVALLDLVERSYAAAPLFPSSVSGVLIACIQSWERRPDSLCISARVLRAALAGLRTSDAQAGYLSQFLDESELEAVVWALAMGVHAVFREERYQGESFSFADKSSITVRRLIDWRPQDRIIAELAIEVLIAVACCEISAAVCSSTTTKGLLMHVGDWIADEAFYDSSNRVKALAAGAAVSVAMLDPSSGDAFTRARELQLALRQQTPDWADILLLFRKVPELLPSSGSARELMKRLMRDCRDKQLILFAVSEEPELAEALVEQIHESGLPQGGIWEDVSFLTQIFAFANCHSVDAFVNLFGPLTGLPLLSDSSDVSKEGLARSLFSSSVAERKQASLLLWNSLGGQKGKGVFVPDPLLACDGFSLPNYKMGRIPVSDQEITHAVSIATNKRLSAEIRAASCVQATTLMVNSATGPVVPIEAIKGILSALETENASALTAELFGFLVFFCDRFPLRACEVKAGLDQLINGVYSAEPNVSVLAMHVLSRVLFDQQTVVGSTTEPQPGLFGAVLHKLNQSKYSILQPISSEPPRIHCPAIRDTPEEAFAICVALIGMLGRSDVKPSRSPPRADCAESTLLAGQWEPSPRDDVIKRLVAAVESPPVVSIPSAESHRALSKYVAQLWLLVRVSSASITPSTLASITGLLKTSQSWPGHMHWLVWECLDGIARLVDSSTGRLDSVVPTVVNVMKNSASDHTRRCGLRLLVKLGELGVSLIGASEVLTQLTPLIFAPTNDVFSARALMWILSSFRELEPVRAKIDVSLLSSTPTADATTRLLQWRLLRRLRDSHTSGWAELENRAVDLFVESDDETLNFELSLFIEKSVTAGGVCVNHLVDLVTRRDYPIAPGELLESRLYVLAALTEVRGSELAQILISNEDWRVIFDFARCNGNTAAAAVRLAAASLAADPKLLAYLTHAGLFSCMRMLEHVDSSAVLIARHVQEALRTCAINHYEIALDWMRETSSLLERALEDSKNRSVVFSFMSTVFSTLRENDRDLAQPDSLLESLLEAQPSPLLSVDGCNVLVQLLRVVTSSVNSGAHLPDLMSLMEVHKSVCVPDGAKIGTSAGAALFVAQMRVVAAWTARAGSRSHFCEAYSNWFSSVWQRALLIVPSKQTSPVPVLTELVCGLVEVLVSRSEALADPCWGRPISHVLSFASQNAMAPPHLFSLCLSVAETASEILVNKAVTARIVASLAEEHALIHARNIPKEQSVLAKAAAVIRLSGSLVGCKLSAAEVLSYSDGWVEAVGAFESEVLLRVVCCAILAGGHCRQSVVTTEPLMNFLMDQSKQDLIPSLNELATQALTVLALTSFKNMQTVIGSGG